MKTVGETLQSVRVKQGLSLDEISTRTRIRLEYLQAIETGEFDSLPSSVAAQGFIATVAEVLGIEPKTALSLLRRDYTVTKSKVIPKHLVDPKERETRRKSKFRFAMLFPVVGILVLLLYFGLGVRQLNQPPDLTISSPKTGDRVSSTFVVRGWTVTDATLEIDSEPVSLTQDGEFSHELTLTSGEHTITVVAKNRKQQETIEQLYLLVE